MYDYYHIIPKSLGPFIERVEILWCGVFDIHKDTLHKRNKIKKTCMHTYLQHKLLIIDNYSIHNASNNPFVQPISPKCQAGQLAAKRL